MILKGTFDFVIALAVRHEIDLWWMSLIAGIIEIALGIWAMGYPGSFGGAADHLGRYRRDHPRYRRDRHRIPRAQDFRGGHGMKARFLVLAAMVVLSAFALTSCSTQARAERKGKEAGDEICKAKNANNANDAQRHINRANDKLKDLARFTGRDVREDVRDLDRNLNQMSRGNAIRTRRERGHSQRGGRPVIGQGNAVAAYDGMLEGLANCE